MNQFKVLARQRVARGVITHISRDLSGAGKLNISVGQVVEPHDILGETLVNSGFSSINLARELQVSADQVKKYLQRPIGSTFYKGELLALKKGFLGMKELVVTSPSDCIIEEIDEKSGEIKLKFLPKKVPVFAGMFGVIDQISDQGEVLVRTKVNELYGIFGSGRQRFGELKLFGSKDGLTTKSQITPGLKGQILVCGGLILSDGLRQAVVSEVAGIVAGGFNARDIKAICGSIKAQKQVASDIGISVVMTEGFGAVPIGDDIFESLRPCEGHFVFIDGNHHRLLLPASEPDSIISIRKVILPLGKPTLLPKIVSAALTIGSRVRVIWPPFMGYQGNVVAIDSAPTMLESGVQSVLAMVDMSFRKIKVPIANIELVF